MIWDNEFMPREKLHPTSALQKLFSSTINVGVVLILWLPFYIIIEDYVWQKIIFVGLFFWYNLFFFLFYKNRSLWMMLIWTYYKGKYQKKNHLLYDIFYTASFSTVLFSIKFPFDILLYNILFIQLPMVFFTKTTLHGYLAGKVTTVKIIWQKNKTF